MELAKQSIKDMVSRSENTIEEMFATLSASHTKALELCAYYIDAGFTNCNSTRWAMLLYYPAPAMPAMEINEFARWYVHQNLYMSALSKLTDYLNRLNYIGIEKHMDEYMSFCPQFFSEKDRAAGKANGGPNNEEYCKPEEEVNYKFSNQPKRTLQAAQYPQPSTIIAKQEDSSEPAKESETVADMKKRKMMIQ